MAKKVRKIPATLNQFTSEPVAVRRKKKVAGYARVSTDREEQATSYEAQMTYYKTYIEGHEDWEFVGMYSDATDIIGLKQNPTYGRRFSPIFLIYRAFCGAKRKMLL